jgi:hypothetical protein
MNPERIQILGRIPPNIAIAQIFWVLISDDGNLARPTEIALIVNQCLRYLAEDSAIENVEVSFRILTRLIVERKFLPDRFALELLIPGVERALESMTIESLHTECIHFLSALGEVPPQLVIAVAKCCLPSADRDLSLLAFDLVTAHMDAFATSDDLQQLQVVFTEGLVKNLASVRPQDFEFLGQLIDAQGAAVYFDDATIEVYLGMFETGDVPEKAVELLMRAIDQCMAEGGERIGGLQDKLAEYQDAIDRLAHMEPRSFGALRDKVSEVLA